MGIAKVVAMNVSLYQAASAMNASARWQEIIAQNLSSNSVPGYKKQEISFADIASANAANMAMPQAQQSTNFLQGQIRPTGVATDAAIDGPGFFEVQLASGDTAYTRDGEFQINAQGQMVTKQGYAVQSDSGPIQIDINNRAPISISSDGTVSQGADVKGKLKVVSFNDNQLLTQTGNSYFLALNPNLESGEATGTYVRQGFLESGNSSPMAEMAQLVTAMRQFEANQRVVQVQDERMGRAISELGNPNPV